VSEPGVTAQLLRVGPHGGAHRVAARAAVSVLAPLLVLWGLDRIELTIFATFGAFVSLYGRNQTGVTRTRMQLTLAVALTSSVVLGVVVGLSPQRAWLAVPVAAGLAAVGSLLADAQGWHPPGPLFLIFSFAACASLSTEPADVAVAAVVAGSAAAFSVLVGAVGPLARHRGALRDTSPGGTSRRSYSAVARRHVARNAGSVLIAGTIATASGIGHPYWAMVSAVVPLAARETVPQVVRGIQRMLGTAAGLVIAAALFTLDLADLAIIVVVVALQATAELFVGRNYAIGLLAVTPLALLMVHLAAPVPTGTLLVDRGLETVIGVTVGLLVGWLTRGRPVTS
jgi:Fusaric acid resistance protein-like